MKLLGKGGIHSTVSLIFHGNIYYISLLVEKEEELLQTHLFGQTKYEAKRGRIMETNLGKRNYEDLQKNEKHT